MPLALLVINLHQHLATFDTGPTSALRTGRFLKGVYFKMQASFMLLCGNDESHSITRTDCISAAASSVSSRFLSQYVKVRVDNQSEISFDRAISDRTPYSFLTKYRILVIARPIIQRNAVAV
jgi:hypothetical protein